MKVISLYDPNTGEVLNTTSVQLPIDVNPAAATAEEWLAAMESISVAAGLPYIEGYAEPGTKVENGELVPIPDVVATLADVQAAKIDEIKRRRNVLEVSGFPYLGRVFDSDSRSLQRITTSTLAAQAALSADVDYSVEWTCADNSTIVMDAEQMIGTSVALAIYAVSLHEQAKELKNQVMAAESIAEVEAIHWPSAVAA